MYKFLITGLILSILSGWGIIYAIRVSIAQLIYHNIKFGPNASGYVAHEVSTRCEDAYNFYKHNYYFSILAAEKAWYEHINTGDDVRQKELLALATRWCDIGLNQNKFRSQIRLLKARLLFKENRSQGINYWKEYVEWDFWYPYNHAVLAEMYIDNAEYEKALKTLELIHPFKDAQAIFTKLYTVWQKEVNNPPSTRSSSFN